MLPRAARCLGLRHEHQVVTSGWAPWGGRCRHQCADDYSSELDDDLAVPPLPDITGHLLSVVTKRRQQGRRAQWEIAADTPLWVLSSSKTDLLRPASDPPIGSSFA